MSVCVFLGPTLRVEEARTVLDAEYLPPAARGAIYAAAVRRPSAIAIVDGLFERVPSVWHKEVLWALAEGIPVYGASSMGALRAAELDVYGMVGIGQIYEGFRDGAYEDDDEVAVDHGDASTGFAPVSEAMVNLRAGLARALASAVIAKATHDQLVTLAKAQFYPERSWPSVLKAAERMGTDPGEVERLRVFVRTERPDVKREDALRLLRTLRDGVSPSQPKFRFHATAFWERLVSTLSAQPSGPGAEEQPSGDLPAHLRLTAYEHSELRRGALLLQLLEVEAARRGYAPSPEERAEVARRLAPGAPDRLVVLEALAMVLMTEEPIRLGYCECLELMRTGEFEATLAEASEKWRYLSERGVVPPSMKHVGARWTHVRDWYERRYRPLGESIELHARQLGFRTETEFLAELAAQYLFENRG